MTTGPQKVRLHHPLQFLAATHSVEAWHQVEFLRGKKQGAEVRWVGVTKFQGDKLPTARAPSVHRLAHSLAGRDTDGGQISTHSCETMGRLPASPCLLSPY